MLNCQLFPISFVLTEIMHVFDQLKFGRYYCCETQLKTVICDRKFRKKIGSFQLSKAKKTSKTSITVIIRRQKLLVVLNNTDSRVCLSIGSYFCCSWSLKFNQHKCWLVEGKKFFFPSSNSTRSVLKKEESQKY